MDDQGYSMLLYFGVVALLPMAGAGRTGNNWFHCKFIRDDFGRKNQEFISVTTAVVAVCLLFVVRCDLCLPCGD